MRELVVVAIVIADTAAACRCSRHKGRRSLLPVFRSSLSRNVTVQERHFQGFQRDEFLGLFF